MRHLHGPQLRKIQRGAPKKATLTSFRKLMCTAVLLDCRHPSCFLSVMEPSKSSEGELRTLPFFFLRYRSTKCRTWGSPVHILRGALFGGTEGLFRSHRSSFSRGIPTTRSSGKRGLLNIPREKRQCCPTLVPVCVCLMRGLLLSGRVKINPPRSVCVAKDQLVRCFRRTRPPPGVSEDRRERLMDR